MMESIFLAVLDMSFKASFLILAVVVLRFVLKRAPKYIVCTLWLLVGLRLIVPFSIESGLSLVPQTEGLAMEKESSVTHEEEMLDNEISYLPNEPLIDYAPVSPVISHTPPVEIPVVEIPAQPSENMPAAQEKQPVDWESVVSYIWLGGLMLMLAYLSVSYIMLLYRLREAIPMGEGVWKCAKVRSPFVLGFLRPRIYISFGMNAEQTDFVLAHERSHIARRDHWTKPIGFLVLAIHWFNPLVWLSYILLCRDIELACDERVIRGMEPSRRKGYSEALLMCAVKSSPLAACPLAFGEVGVKKRIKSVLQYKKPKIWIIIAALLCAVAAGVFFLTDPRADFDCPEEVEDAITAYLGDRERSGLVRYKLTDISLRNDNLYSFSFEGKLARRYDAEYYGKYGFFQPDRDISKVYYAYFLDECWNITGEFSDIPAYILCGQAYDCPDAVLETYNRWIAANTPATASYNDFLELYYLPEGYSHIGIDGWWPDLESSEILSVTKVNAALYEIRTVYTMEYSDEEYDNQFFVGYYEGKWWMMYHEYIPAELRSGLENFALLTYTDDGIVYVPAGEDAKIYPSYPVKAHLMDKLTFSLPTMHSTGNFSTEIGSHGGGVGIYYADGSYCGLMELNLVFDVWFENGEIVRSTSDNHGGFSTDFESIEHDVPCAIAQYSVDDYDYAATRYTGTKTNYWYVLFAKEGCGHIYALKLHTGYFTKEEAIEIAQSVRFADNAFDVIDYDELVYWDTIDAYANALARGASGLEMHEMGLNRLTALTESDDPLGELGYAIRDIDGNGVKELMIGCMNSDPFYGKMIFSLYSQDESHNPQPVFLSSERSRYHYIAEGEFYYHGSSSAEDSTDSIVMFSMGKQISRDTVNMGQSDFGDPMLTPFSAVTDYSDGYGVYLTADEALMPSAFMARVLFYVAGEEDGQHVPHSTEIVNRVFNIINSGAIEKYSDEEFRARMNGLDGSNSKILFMDGDKYDFSVSLIEDELGPYFRFAYDSGHEYYRIIDPAAVEEAKLILVNAPQQVYVNYNDLAEYSLSNGLELGMSYEEILSVMGTPHCIESESASFDVRLHILHYIDEAILYCYSHDGGGYAESELYFAQIFTDDVSTARDLRIGDSASKAWQLYGMACKEIEGEYLPVLGALSIRAGEYYNSCFALTPDDSTLWENGAPPSMVFLFTDDVLSSIYLRPTTAIDSVTALAAPHRSRLRFEMQSVATVDLDGDGIMESISQNGKGEITVNGKVYDFGGGMDDPERSYFYVVDLDDTDKYLEIVLVDKGLNGNSESRFLRFIDGKFTSAGSIPAHIKDIDIEVFEPQSPIKAICTAPFRCSLLHNWTLNGSWILESDKLSLARGMEYFPTTEHWWIDPETGEHSDNFLLLTGDITVYKDKNTASLTEVLGSGERILLMGSDNEEWVRIMDTLGGEWWLHTKDGISIDTPGGAVDASERIRGLNNAG